MGENDAKLDGGRCVCVLGRCAYRLSASDKHYFWSLCWDEGVG